MTKVSIVIVNWNGWKDTVECLKSIESLSLPRNIELDVIIVDNGSTNDSVSQIKKHLKKNVELLEANMNLGFAGGNNKGIERALQNKSDYVMILNNDTILDQKIVTELVTCMEKYPDAGALSPKMYFAKGFEFHKDRYTKNDLGKVIWYAGGDIDWKNVYGSNHGVDEVDNGQFSTVTETSFGSGACLFLRVSALKKVGVFDEKYFLYLEDTDLSLRLREAGYKIYMVPTAVLWHKVSQSSAIGSQLNDYFITRNRLLFASKYANLRANIALFRESIRFLTTGREWQKKGVMDFYVRKLGKGSWKN